MPVTPKLGLELFAPLGVGWREDATAGALLDYNMMLLDAASGGGGSSVSINSALVSDPNFKDSATVTFSVSGSNVTATAASAQVNSDWNSIAGVSQILNKPLLFVNPMTVHGDIIYENASLGPTALPIGLTGQILSVVGGQPAWETLTLAASDAGSAHHFLTAYSATTGAFGQAQPAVADLSDTPAANFVLAGPTSGAAATATFRALVAADIPAPVSGTILWSALGNAGGNLTLSNANYTTEFDQTSAVNWIWKNTTAAIVGVPLTIGLIGSVAVPNSTPVGFNTAVATLLVAILSEYSTTNQPTISDSLGNAWNYISKVVTTGTQTSAIIAYAYAKTGGGALVTGTDTFTIPNLGGGASGIVYAFSNTLTTASVYRGQHAEIPNPTSPFQIGSVTPVVGGLVVSGFTRTSTLGTPSVDSGFSTPVQQANAANDALAAAYLVSSSGSAVNPTWTISGGTGVIAGLNAAFVPATSPIGYSSPIINLSGSVWDSVGPASIVDNWSIQNVCSAPGTDSPSTLTIAHTGTSGYASVSLPNLALPSGGELAWNADSGISRLGAASLAVGNGAAGDKSGQVACAVRLNTGFTVALLPSTAATGMVGGAVAYATDGLKVGETTGNGTGVPVYYSNGHWRVYSTDLTVAA